MKSKQANLSPYSPPEAYNPPKVDDIPYEELHPFLQSLIDEHKKYDKKIIDFEETLTLIENGKVDKEIDKRLRDFFEYFDEEVRTHHLEEEKTLFAPISAKMKERGDQSKGTEDFNAIDILEDEHIKSIQMAAVTFNLFALFARIPDERSRIIILDTALEQAKAFVELLKLHIFREDTMIFSYAQRHLSAEELDEMKTKKGL